MQLINCEVKLKRRQIKHCVFNLLGTGNDYVNADSDNITVTIKDTNFHVPVITLPEKVNQKLSKPLRKGFEDPCNEMDIKQKMRKSK